DPAVDDFKVGAILRAIRLIRGQTVAQAACRKPAWRVASCRYLGARYRSHRQPHFWPVGRDSAPEDAGRTLKKRQSCVVKTNRATVWPLWAPHLPAISG